VIVTDTSVLVSFILKEEGWESLGKILREEPVSLELALKEAFNSVLTARRKGVLKKEELSPVLQALRELSGALELHPQLELLERAFQIGLDSGITVYDALFLSLAEKLHCPLVSLDQRQAEVAKKLGIRVLGTV
jgi:predicted nucleic acid-binding protein